MALIFQEHPVVLFASHTFVNVPTILQYEDTPLFEIGTYEPAGYSAKFHVFNGDGRSLVVVKGTQLYETEDGKKSNVRLVHEPNLTACELNGQTILELRREGAAALKGWAELYAPDGYLVRAPDSDMSHLVPRGPTIMVGGTPINGTMVGDTLFGCALIQNCHIGILVTEGRITIGYTDLGKHQTCAITGHLPGCPPVSSDTLPMTKRPDVFVGVFAPKVDIGRPIEVPIEVTSDGRSSATIEEEFYFVDTGPNEAYIEQRWGDLWKPPVRPNRGLVMPPGSRFLIPITSDGIVDQQLIDDIAIGRKILFVGGGVSYSGNGRKYISQGCFAFDATGTPTLIEQHTKKN